MFFPESLLRFSPQDFDGLQPLIHRPWLDPATAAISVNAVYTVPADRSLLLTGVCACFEAGAAQLVNEAKIGLLHAGLPLTDPTLICLLKFSRPGTQFASLDWQGQVVVPPNVRVILQGVFNAAGVANIVRRHIVGMLMPAANLKVAEGQVQI